MPVAYLEHDWKDSLVATKERGRKFITAVHVFDTTSGKAAVAFFKGFAMRVQDDDGDFLASEDLLDYIKDNVDEPLWDDEEFESVILIDRYGTVMERPVSFQGIDVAELQKMYADCNRYWKTDPELENDDDD